MFQGTVSRLSFNTQATASEIQGNVDVVLLTGTEDIDTIVPRVSGVGAQLIHLIATGGAVALTTDGNISAAETIPDEKCIALVYHPSTGKWYPQSAA